MVAPRGQALPVVMPIAVVLLSGVAIPTRAIPVIDWRWSYNDGPGHNHRARRGAKRWRRHHNWRRLANDYARQGNPDSDAHLNTGLRGRNGPE